MPKNYSSLLYTVHLLIVIVMNTLFNVFNANTDANNAGAIAMSVVLSAFVLFIIFRSIQYVDTTKKHLVLWGGLLVVVLGSVVVQLLLKGTDFERYSIVGSILVAFLVNFIGSKWIESTP